jgi:DNA repair protein RadC
MEQYENNTPIKLWAEDDRPREKLLQKGRHALSDAELIAILLGTGRRGESALELSQKLLARSGNNLMELSKLGVAELKQGIKGIGEAKAVTLIAALELGNRKRASGALRRNRIKSSMEAWEYLRSFMDDNQYEVFWMLVLNRANRILNRICISEGGVGGTVADPKKIFKIALEQGASGILLAHNHPSGSETPSQADILLTSKLKKAGEFLDLPVIDHIILGEEKYYSFADQGAL